jgi:hypothetical protein
MDQSSSWSSQSQRSVDLGQLDKYWASQGVFGLIRQCFVAYTQQEGQGGTLEAAAARVEQVTLSKEACCSQ